MNEIDLSDISILLVEDVEINSLMTIKYLEETGAKIDVVKNGWHAVEKFKENPVYDLILMDLSMPYMNGYEATKLIRAMNEERAKTVPIIAISALELKENIDEAIEAGMNCHLSKPLNKGLLISTILEYTNAGS